MDQKQYIISMIATLKGDKVTMSKLKTMEAEIDKTGKTVAKTEKGMAKFGASLANIAKRAILTIPAWLLLRSVFMGIIRVVGNMMRAQINLEEGMARIKTVMHGTSEEIKIGMIAAERQILDMATKTKIPIKELAEAFYFLKTASLSVEESMAAFTPTVHAMVGTGVSAKEMARAVAGIYNTMGEALGENLTITEKFAKINDVLTYTYSTQDVQMDELIQGYTKLAPFITGLDDSFVSLITTLGVLNTHMLRGGRTGRLTARTILQLTKNASKLASIFGITFDSDKPITFINVLEKLKSALGDSTKITFQQGEALRQVFETRGAAAPRLLIPIINELTEAIGLAGENAGGFAKKMSDIRMMTVASQMDRMQNILATLTNDFISGAVQAGSFANGLSEINDGLLKFSPLATRTGQLIGWLALNMGALVESFKSIGKINTSSWLQNLLPTHFISEFTKHLKRVDDMQLKGTSWREYIKSQELIIEKSKEEEKIRQKITKADEEANKIKLNATKEEKELNSHNINLLKTLGASELDIARYKLDALKISQISKTEEEFTLELMKAQNGVLEEQEKFTKNLVEKYKKSELDMLKASGINELQILEYKEQQLMSQKETMGATQYLLQLNDLRVQQALALKNAQENELQTAVGLAMEYEKASKYEKARIRRMMELRQLTPKGLSVEYEMGGFDKKIIEDFFSKFSQTQQKAVGEFLLAQRDLPTGLPEQAPISEDFMQGFAFDIPEEFWNNWVSRGTIAIEEMKKKYGLIGDIGTQEGLYPKGTSMALSKEATQAKHPISVSVGPVTVNVDVENVIEEVKKQITDKLKNNQDLLKQIAKGTRPYI